METKKEQKDEEIAETRDKVACTDARVRGLKVVKVVVATVVAAVVDMRQR